MPISTVPVTGSVSPPDGSSFVSGEVRFRLSGPDTEGGVAIAAETVATLVAGALPGGFTLWRNTAGIRGTYYTVDLNVLVNQGANGAGQTILTRKSYRLGNVQTGNAASYTLTELLNNPVPTAPGWNVNLDPGAWADLQDQLASLEQMPKAPEEFGAVGNGVADDTAALNAWAAATGPKAAYGRYVITSTFTIPANAKIGGDFSLIWGGASTAQVLTVGDDAKFGKIRFTSATATGLTASMGKRVEFDLFSAISAVQSTTSFLTLHPTVNARELVLHNFTNACLIDGSIWENSLWRPYLYVDPNDATKLIPWVNSPSNVTRYRNDGQSAGVPAFIAANFTRPGGGRIDVLRITGYRRGIWFRYVDGFSFGTFSATAPSAGVSGLPGENGFLFNGASNITFDDVTIEDSGEHAGRISGDWAQVGCSNIWIKKYKTVTPSESHLKVNGNQDTVATWNGSAWVSAGQVKRVTKSLRIDEWGGVGNYTGGGNNSDFARLTSLDGMTIGRAVLRLADGATEAVQDVLSMDAVTDVQIGSLDCEDGITGHVVAVRGEQDGGPAGNVDGVSIEWLRAIGARRILNVDTKGDGAFANTWATFSNFRVADGIFQQTEELANRVGSSGISGFVEISGRALASTAVVGFTAGQMRVDLRPGSGGSIFGDGTAPAVVSGGTGTPEGAVAAPVGSLRLRTNGTVMDGLYIKQTGGTGNTGWRAAAVDPAPDTALAGPALVTSAQELRRSGVPLRMALGRSYSSGNDGAGILNSVLGSIAAAGLTITDPDGLTVRCTQPIRPATSGTRMHFGPQTLFTKDFASTGNTNALFCQSDFTVNTDNLTIFGGVWQALQGGVMFAVWGNDMFLSDLVIRDFTDGQGITFGGDRVRLINIISTTENPATGTGAIRYLGGKDMRAIGCRAKCGDDALQLVPVGTSTAARFGVGIEDAWYIGCTGVSATARVAVVQLAIRVNPSNTAYGGIRGSGFIGCTGVSPATPIQIVHERPAGSTVVGTDSNRIDDIVISGFRASGARPGTLTEFAQGILIQDEVGDGIGRVTLRDVAVQDNNLAIGIKFEASNAQLLLDNCELTGEETALQIRTGSRVTIRGGELSIRNNGGLTTYPSGTRTPVSVIQTIAAGSSSIVLEGRPVLNGVPTSGDGVRIQSGHRLQTGLLEVNKAAGATTTQAINAVSGGIVAVGAPPLGTVDQPANFGVGTISLLYPASSGLPSGAVTVTDAVNTSYAVTALASLVYEAGAPTVARTKTVNVASWVAGQTMLVHHTSSSAGVITWVKSDGGTLGILTGAGDWFRVVHDGTTLVVLEGSYRCTVAALPAASTAPRGLQITVTDANATTFQSIVAGGGSNQVPVYSDGTNWRIG